MMMLWFVTLALPAPVAHAWIEEGGVPLFLETTGASGATLFRAFHSDGLTECFTAEEYNNLNRQVNVRLVHIYPDGPFLIPQGVATSGNSGLTRTDPPQGAYLGHAETVVYKPVNSERPYHDALGGGCRTHPVNEMMILFTWSNLHETGFWFNYTWAAGTTITEVARGETVSFDMTNFTAGTRAGVGPALRVNIADRLTFDPDGGQVFGSLLYRTPGQFGVGNLSLRSRDFSRELNLSTTPVECDRFGSPVRCRETADAHDATVYGCGCPQEGRWLFTTHAAIEATLDFVGENVYPTNLLLTFTRLPAGSLPDRFWNETTDLAPHGWR